LPKALRNILHGSILAVSIGLEDLKRDDTVKGLLELGPLLIEFGRSTLTRGVSRFR